MSSTPKTSPVALNSPPSDLVLAAQSKEIQMDQLCHLAPFLDAVYVARCRRELWAEEVRLFEEYEMAMRGMGR